ncbi:protein ERGIC-53-like [Octodon degus]|uniref:Protein ERGIC-53-like n=1 Tax=Octodon degus TaxID=10160 RepID=A0A6P6E854_OCTDE|nr:protein ERGIC-53-like [Octodon degus]
MPGAQGPDVLLCLLFLLLLTPHSAEGIPPPLPVQRRFEYKLSFKGPRMAWPGTGIPFWSHHGDAIPGPEEVRLAPSLRNRSGAVWSRAMVLFPAWEVEIQMRVTGPGHRGGQGMVVWYTQDGSLVGSVPRWLASRDSVGIFFDSSSEDNQNSPVIRVLAGDGHSPHEQLGDGGSRVLGSCHWDFRNRPYPLRAKITYWKQRLRVSLSSGFTPNDPEEVCTDVGPLLLAPGGYFGVSAATGTLADDYDVLSFLTFSLSNPSPEASPRPFLETEQLHLAKQLEELRERLGLGTRKNMHPQPNARAQEEEERLFDLQETLSRHSRILQALWGLSEHLAQVKKQWKQQLGSLGWARSDGWDSAKVSTLNYGQRTLLQSLQEIRDVAARMALESRVVSLPVGTEHHFLELDQILSLLHKDLQGTEKAAGKGSRLPGWHPGTPACLQPGIFLLFLLIQTAGFFYYVYFRQELDKRLQECWSLGSLPLGLAPAVPRVLGASRRQPFSSTQA